MSKIKVILFDLDGTLRDSREMIYGALEHAMNTHTGTTPSRGEMLPYVHHHTEIYKNFASHIDEEKFLESYWEKVEELRPSSEPYDGATDIVGELKKSGYRLGIVTSASTAAEFLAQHGMADSFDAIVGGADVAEHKPSSIPVLRALELMNSDPKHAVMVGDLSVDIEAAKAAGLAGAVGILHGFGTADMLEKAGADVVISTYDQLKDAIHKIEGM